MLTAIEIHNYSQNELIPCISLLFEHFCSALFPASVGGHDIIQLAS